ncbi:hypothetical protein [Paenibacillus wenxiniae]|uniref:Uncharacterized protein n=1 Tax=Paenibacillus wenxiniae TaxID=1636843 RepID=A0ABW4REQ6_9BACL
MRGQKEAIRKQFYAQLEILIAEYDYTPFKTHSTTDYTFMKKAQPDVDWYLHSHLSHAQPPYTVFTVAACRYIAATKRLNAFLDKHQITSVSHPAVGFGEWVDKHAQIEKVANLSADKKLVNVTADNIEEAARQACERIMAAESACLLPRVEQSKVVEEYLTKRPHQWPTSDLFNCCAIIVSYGLLTDDPVLIKRGIERTFEILNKPNYSQRNREFFEAVRDAVHKEFG